MTNLEPRKTGGARFPRKKRDFIAFIFIAGFVLIMFGFPLQWPTLVTLAMFLILVYMYAWLAKREERDAAAEFGEAYLRYAARTPAYFPSLGAARSAQG